MSGHPPRSGAGKPPSKTTHQSIPTEWRIELPESGAMADAEFGGCRSIEAGYRRGVVLGQGTYGEVYLATDLQTNEKVAAKKIKMDNEKEGFPITAIREIKILSALAGATEKLGDTLLRNNVIGLREIVRSGSHRANNFKGSIYMMFDYMDHDMTGLLERSQKEGRKFTAPQVKCYLKQLFCGLALLENHEVLHRDLKNANLLVSDGGELKIADFGLARYFHKRDETGGNEAHMTNRVITLWYRPPELFLGADKYGTEIDMWSAGCIMFELLTGKPLFPGKDEIDQVEKIFSIMGQPTEATMPGCTKYPSYNSMLGGGVINRYPARGRLRQYCETRGVNDPQALELLEKLLALNPAARINATSGATHPYFFTNPFPCKPSEMPKFASSHEMTMKRARHEQRHGGGQQQRQQQQQAPVHHEQQQRQGQQQAAGPGGPPAQRQRTQGQYSGAQQAYPQQPQQQAVYRGGTGGVPQQMPPPGQQQPYRGGGGGGAPAAGMPGGAMRMPQAPAGGMMGPPVILSQAQVQQLGLVPSGLLQQQAGMQLAGGGGYAGYMGQQQQAGRGAGGMGPGPGNTYGAPASGAPHVMQPHRSGGGARPAWESGKR